MNFALQLFPLILSLRRPTRIGVPEARFFLITHLNFPPECWYLINLIFWYWNLSQFSIPPRTVKWKTFYPFYPSLGLKSLALNPILSNVPQIFFSLMLSEKCNMQSTALSAEAAFTISQDPLNPSSHQTSFTKIRLVPSRSNINSWNYTSYTTRNSPPAAFITPFRNLETNILTRGVWNFFLGKYRFRNQWIANIRLLSEPWSS